MGNLFMNKLLVKPLYKTGIVFKPLEDAAFPL